MKNFKKILAFALVFVMVFGMSVISRADETETEELPDLILDGGEEGKSTMIGHFDAPKKKGTPTDDYKYLGYASFLDMVPEKSIEEGNYRYLVMTYTGDITQLRLEFNHLYEDETQDLPGPFWFNPEGQTCYFVTADGSEIPLIGDNTTIVIDLLNSVHPEDPIDADGVDLSWYYTGIHMHCDEMITHGNAQGFDITEAYLTVKNPFDEPETEEETEPETEEPATEAPTEPETEEVTEPDTEAPTEEVIEPETEAPTEPETEEPATEAPTEAETEAPTEAVTEPETEKSMEAIILDGGEEGKSSFIKHFVNTNAATYDAEGNMLEPAYKYLGYVSFLDLANENYKYLAMTYTGDIKFLRLQFVHDAGGKDEEFGDVLWFDPEQENHFVTADGSEIPLVGNNTTIIIDLEKSGAEMDWYNSGMHVHVNDIADINVTYAALLTELPKEGEELPTENTVDPANVPDKPNGGNGGNGGKTPATGDNMPVAAAAAAGILSLAVLGATVVIRKRRLQ
ncbi:MAG: hypothetical protein IJM37_07770 [Lachnospiraceae bacterium]|nr:hypothetical protein [Lachnospiraceae bacterium]